MDHHAIDEQPPTSEQPANKEPLLYLSKYLACVRSDVIHLGATRTPDGASGAAPPQQ